VKSLLETAIKKTEEDPVVRWNDDRWPSLVNQDEEFTVYMNNLPIAHHNNERVTGYFALLHNIVSSLSNDAVICELGNREGLSTISILDSMKDDQIFITIDTAPDLRFVPSELANPMINSGIFQAVIGDCTDYNTLRAVDQFAKGKSIDLLFCDTIHTYEQVKLEFETYESLLSDEAIILVDDIQNDFTHKSEAYHRTKYRFYEEWTGEKYDITKLCHNPSGFAAFIYRRKK
jgi:predicted O-methyltransferase YrrM